MSARGSIAKRLALVAGTFAFLAAWAVAAPAALAQVTPDPNVVPTKNTGGFVYGMAVLVGILGVIVVILIVVSYLRFAPRFQRDEQGRKRVRADRVAVGEDFPRRAVDISQAQQVVVAPPVVPVGAAAAAPAAAAPATAAAPAAATPAPAPAAASPAPAPAAAAAAPAPAAAASPAPAPAAATPAPAPAAASPAPAPAPTSERPEVSLDEAVFEAKLAELLEQGVSRRVAEGQARRAAMIAARKKAEGS